MQWRKIASEEVGGGGEMKGELEWGAGVTKRMGSKKEEIEIGRCAKGKDSKPTLNPTLSFFKKI